METILVASDDVVLVNRLDWLLTEAGFDVKFVSTVAAARSALVPSALFSLVIADIRVPDGGDVAELVGDIPIVVLGSPPPPLRERVTESGGAVVDEPDMLTFHGRLVGALH